MSGKGRRDDKRIANAVAFKIRCQGASIPEAMSATKFTLKESEDTAKQMAVRCAYQKAVNAPSAVLVNSQQRSGSDFCFFDKQEYYNTTISSLHTAGGATAKGEANTKDCEGNAEASC